MLAGLASSAIVARESRIINVSSAKQTVETVYRLAVILWLSPILLNPAVLTHAGTLWTVSLTLITNNPGPAPR